MTRFFLAWFHSSGTNCSKTSVLQTQFAINSSHPAPPASRPAVPRSFQCDTHRIPIYLQVFLSYEPPTPPILSRSLSRSSRDRRGSLWLPSTRGPIFLQALVSPSPAMFLVLYVHPSQRAPLTQAPHHLQCLIHTSVKLAPLREEERILALILCVKKAYLR